MLVLMLEGVMKVGVMSHDTSLSPLTRTPLIPTANKLVLVLVEMGRVLCPLWACL
mgnify:CR=1 FL=1